MKNLFLLSAITLGLFFAATSTTSARKSANAAYQSSYNNDQTDTTKMPGKKKGKKHPGGDTTQVNQVTTEPNTNTAK